MTGIVKFFNNEKGFGFIIADDQSGEMFFHISQCAEDYEPQENDKVSFDIGEGRKGPQAENVVLIEAASEAGDVDAFAMAA